MVNRVGKCLLADLLKKADVSQAELARRLDIPKQQINKYVKNKRYMSAITMQRIAKELNCSIDDLYTWDDEEDCK